MKYIFLTILVFYITGCKDEIGNTDDLEIPSSKVSYSVHIQPVLEAHCTGCHDAQNAAGGLILTSYSNTTADPGVVFPGEPGNSRLVWRIDPTYGASQMPPLGSIYKPLNKNQITGIKTWISEGAKNN